MAAGSGPSILVRIFSDLSAFSAGIQKAGDQAGTVGARMRSAFSGALSGLSQTGVLGPLGTALDGVSNSLDKVGDHATSAGTKVLAIGGITAGVGTALAALGSKDQAAHQQLQAAVEATGKSYDDYAGKIDDAVKSQEKYGNTAHQTSDALRVLTQATHDPAEALKLLNETTDVAAAKHIDLVSAATQIGRVYNGNTKVLKEFGVQADKAVNTTKGVEAATRAATTADTAAQKAQQHLTDVQAELAGKTTLTTAEQVRLRDAQQNASAAADKASAAHTKLAGTTNTVVTATQAGASNLQKLADVTKGQAAASADTFGGKLKALKAHLEDTVAEFGQKWGPAIQAAGIGMVALGSAMEVLPAILGAVSAAYDAMAISEYIALGPILLIILAVVALGVGIYLLVTHFSEVWAAIQSIISAVWDWISTHWPLLVAIILGPFVTAIYLIVTHWDQFLGYLGDLWNLIKQGFAIVGQFIVGIWQAVAGFVSGIVDQIAGFFRGLWNDVVGAAGFAAGLVKGAWDDVVGFFTGLPGRIGSVVSGMWDGILNAFRDVINGVIDLWNKLHFTLPHIDLGPLGEIGGGDIGVPQIPHLAQGGLITRTGLIYAHAGEAITPAADVGPHGPAVVINDAHFHDEVDLEVLMRQVAWQARTRQL